MGEIIKTKNGYKTRVYLGREQTGYDENGKPTYRRIIQQVSARTQSELKAKVRALEANEKEMKGKLSFKKAFEQYITAKRINRSPSTIIRYTQMKDNIAKHCPWFMAMNIYDIDEDARQRVVDELAKHYTLNSVKNYDAIISCVLNRKDIKNKPVDFSEWKDTSEASKIIVPEEVTIKTLINACRGSILEPAILLAAFGPMRRGEIAGLTWKDFDFTNNTVTIHQAMIRDEEGKYIIKAPKTKSSKRTLEYPQWVMDRIREHDDIMPLTLENLSIKFGRFLKKNNLPAFRFHDLRHFATSYYIEQGIPEATVQRRGGWSTTHVMKQVYTHEQNKHIHDEQVISCLNSFKN